MDVIDAYTNADYTVVSEAEAEQITDMEHGRITRIMEILGAEIHDEHGQPSRSFVSGETATLAVRLKVNRAVHEPIIGMGVRTADGTVVYGTSSAMHPVSVGDLAAGEEIVASYSLTLNLCQGTYSINAAAAPSDGRVLMDWRENLVSFNIIGNQKDTGIADLKASISLGLPSPSHAHVDGFERQTADGKTLCI
jgi:hypothetical protein